MIPTVSRILLVPIRSTDIYIRLELVVKPYMLFDNTRLIRECDDDEAAHHHDEEEAEKARKQGLTPCELAAQKLK